MKAKARVILYTKPDCHLCEKAKVAIQAANCSELYTLEEINIESDAALFDRYRYDIPVIVINGVEAFRHRLAAREFRECLMNTPGLGLIESSTGGCVPRSS